MRLPEQKLHRRCAIGLALTVATLVTACADVGNNSGDNRTADAAGNSGDGSMARAASDAPPDSARAATINARRAVSAAGDFVVIRSMGPSAGGFAAGTRIGADGVVTLARGDRLVVTDGTQTRTLSGPGRFDLGTPVPATGNSVGTAQDYAEALVEGEGRSAAAATRRTIGPPGSGGPRQPPALANGSLANGALSDGAIVQVQVPPGGSIAPRPRLDPAIIAGPRTDGPRTNIPRTDGPRIVRPRIDPLAPRNDSAAMAAAPPAPDAPAAARMQPPPAVNARQPPRL